MQVTILVSLIPKKELIKEFFAQSYSKGFNIKLKIVNRKKVKKDF
jgi:hypothetical protein